MVTTRFLCARICDLKSKVWQHCNNYWRVRQIGSTSGMPSFSGSLSARSVKWECVDLETSENYLLQHLDYQLLTCWYHGCDHGCCHVHGKGRVRPGWPPAPLCPPTGSVSGRGSAQAHRNASSSQQWSRNRGQLGRQHSQGHPEPQPGPNQMCFYSTTLAPFSRKWKQLQGQRCQKACESCRQQGPWSWWGSRRWSRQGRRPLWGWTCWPAGISSLRISPPPCLCPDPSCCFFCPLSFNEESSLSITLSLLSSSKARLLPAGSLKCQGAVWNRLAMIGVSRCWGHDWRSCIFTCISIFICIWISARWICIGIVIVQFWVPNKQVSADWIKELATRKRSLYKHKQNTQRQTKRSPSQALPDWYEALDTTEEGR